MLFIGRHSSRQLSVLLSPIDATPVLTIGDTEGYARRGIHVNFFINENGQIRFEINHAAAQKAGLKISHLLLGLARIVDPAKEGGTP